MSKKSRKKQKAEEPSAPIDAQKHLDAPVSEGDHNSVEVEVTEEILETVEIAADADSTEEAMTEVPEVVTEEALHGSVPEGEAPRLSHVIEAILFASQKAVSPRELAAHLKSAATAEPVSVASAFARIREPEIREALLELQAEVAASGRAYQVRETASGWLLSSASGYAPWLRALYPEAKPTRLSPSALETLAIIAYRQPIARADMEAVRGVSVDGVMQTLLDRGLVKIAGRSEAAGRPLLYATTQYFLDHFGLRHLDELPNAAELRHIPLPKATAEESTSPEGDDSTPELPGVSEGDTEEKIHEEPAEEPLETVEVTEIIEVRESVVFEEVSFDPEQPVEGNPESGEKK
jgi:segregation and condensation protein B